MPSKVTIERILDKKAKGEKIVMLTAPDYPLARLIDDNGADIVLVGDSLANTVLGLASTREVGMTEMLHHAKAVRRAVQRALLVGDMPFEAYQVDPADAVAHARRFIKEAGCDAVKVEWFDRCPEVVAALTEAGIPVMGHVGLTPQTADQLGGMKLQGKNVDSAKVILDQACLLEEKGCFSVVLECMPRQLARVITEDLSVPTIGIGAGPDCDGQVLVIHDLLGLSQGHRPKFVKHYAELGPVIGKGVADFCREAREGTYPDREHSYSMKGREDAPDSPKESSATWKKKFLRALARHMLFMSRRLIKSMPYPVFRLFTDFFIGLGHCFMMKKRRLAMENLGRVFGREKSTSELQKIAAECFADFGRGMVEVIYYADRPALIPKVVDIEGKEHLDEVLKQGHGAICVSAHFGNFLLMYFRMICAGYKTNVIMRRTRDEKFEKYISDFRQSFGLKTIYDIPPRKCIQQSLRALRNNEVLFILLDQNYGTDGRVFVDFLGYQAATAAGPVVFSCRTQAPVLPVFISRQERDRHKIVIEPPVELEKCGNEQETLVRNVSAITKVIEKHIRQAPAQWGGWMHKRWKSRTVEEQTLVDRLRAP